MRTIEIKILKFEELDAKGKERAKQDYAADNGYDHADEDFASIKALAEHFGGKIKDYNVDFFKTSHSSMEFDMPDDMTVKEMRTRLKALGKYNPATGKGVGECKLTGYCMDEDAIDGFRKAFKEGERNLEVLMQAAFETWLEAAQSSCEAFYEDEEFGQHCDANDYEFYESGKFYVPKKVKA